MKKFLFILLLLPVLAQAQWTRQIVADSSYANGDTTQWFNITPFNGYILGFYFKDSANVSIRADYRGAGAPSTVFQTYNLEADSTNSTTAAGLYLGYDFRGETDNIPGASEFRLIIPKKTTKNGVTSPTYDVWLTQY